MKTNFSIKQVPFYILLLITVFLPFDFFLGPAILLLFFAILVAQPLAQTFANLQQNKLFILFSCCYLIYLAGMLWTENQSFGRRDLEYKLSLLILPILLAAMDRIDKPNFQLILKAFIASCIIASISCFIISYSKNSFTSIPTYIELSIFMHPSYFSAYLNLAFVFLAKGMGFNHNNSKNKLIAFSIAVFIIGFNFLLNSKIGIIISLLLVFIFLVQSLNRYSKKSTALFISLFVLSVALVFTQVDAVKKRFRNIGRTFAVENIPKDSMESSQLRILVWQEVLEILQQQPLLGVGTGDTKDELINSYQKNGITYAFNNRLNAHNQYLEWLLTFGVIGTLFWLVSFLYPIILSLKEANQLYAWFCFIVLIVFFVESFLEREYGVVFFAFFNSLLFFHTPADNRSSV